MIEPTTIAPAVATIGPPIPTPVATQSRWIGVGTLGGLTRATGFSAFKAQPAGHSSQFDWIGTFLALLLEGLRRSDNTACVGTCRAGTE